MRNKTIVNRLHDKKVRIALKYMNDIRDSLRKNDIESYSLDCSGWETEFSKIRRLKQTHLTTHMSGEVPEIKLFRRILVKDLRFIKNSGLKRIKKACESYDKWLEKRIETNKEIDAEYLKSCRPKVRIREFMTDAPQWMREDPETVKTDWSTKPFTPHPHQQKMMYRLPHSCPQCKKDYRDDGVYCPFCGYHIEAVKKLIEKENGHENMRILRLLENRYKVTDICEYCKNSDCWHRKDGKDKCSNRILFLPNGNAKALCFGHY